MTRPWVSPTGGRYLICQVCDVLNVRRCHTAKSFCITHGLQRRRASAAVRAVTTGAASATSGRSRSSPWLAARISTGATRRASETATAAASRHGHLEAESKAEAGMTGAVGKTQPSASKAVRKELSSVTDLMAYLEASKAKILTHKGIPSETKVGASLWSCQVVADYIMDETVQPQIVRMVRELDSAASHLLSLDCTGSRQPAKRLSPTSGREAAGSVAAARGVHVASEVQKMVDKIAETAYAIVVHPSVIITPSLLRQYVHIQVRLAKAEMLPGVLDLYASKANPRLVTTSPGQAGRIEYDKGNSNKIGKAVEASVAEEALASAIEAKKLDAAIGIIESSYTTKSFLRAKVLRKGLLPGVTAVAMPFVAYNLAKSFATLQEAMDQANATHVAFVGIVSYVALTASLGFVALSTANDQMRRVTWAPGVPLRSRLLREEERAALDRVACAWGFQEKWRHGEETGVEWDSLREYLGQREMVLDNPQLLEGME